MDMVSAIAQSCDVYFYEIARKTGIDRIASMARRLGLGQILDAGLPGEQRGLIPTRAWKRQAKGTSWQQEKLYGDRPGFYPDNSAPTRGDGLRLVNGGRAVRPSLTVKLFLRLTMRRKFVSRENLKEQNSFDAFGGDGSGHVSGYKFADRNGIQSAY